METSVLIRKNILKLMESNKLNPVRQTKAWNGDIELIYKDEQYFDKDMDTLKENNIPYVGERFVGGSHSSHSIQIIGSHQGHTKTLVDFFGLK